ncbi:hypothetical protein CBR_g45754 [Chara braunii]|uniref:Uncharacterized protein n=1 Tax=Chara braunii TaxID=69332 RepID=A0A388LZE0_CHABU|nr:hypothetical protein CBR_g45754 [Chara braunii]|eukprot:GBG87602.1 hypothetical protein CBR_g45754 [Chara braunii]
MKAWYDEAMVKAALKKQEEEKLKKEKEEEDRRLKEKKDREAFQKEMNHAMNARLESVCDAFRGQKKNAEVDVQKIEALGKEIQGLKVAHSTMARNDGTSTSRMGVQDDALLARILQEREETKAKMEVATVANKRAESLEEALRLLKQQHEDALLEAENWKKEALQTGNKWSRLATSPSSTLKRSSSTLKIPHAATP